jgi:hypothetical protein
MRKINKKSGKWSRLYCFFSLFSFCFIFVLLVTMGRTINDLFLETEDVPENNVKNEESLTLNEDFSYSFQQIENVDLFEFSRRVKKEGIRRFFLSEVVVNDLYVPKIHVCLFNQNDSPRYPHYIYDSWSSLSYPEESFPEIALVRYLLLPEDNDFFQPDKSCYIKEIVSENDWIEVNGKYKFFEELF